MLADLYIKALLIDEDLADEVWELADAGVITDDVAASAWLIIAFSSLWHRPANLALPSSNYSILYYAWRITTTKR